MITESQVMTALEAVRDPELDESVVALDFVAGVVIEGTDVHVTLRLPTFFCAANFAWLMVSDARHALSTLPGVGAIEVTLPDHYASDEITAGVNGRGDFDAAFDGEGDGGGLDELRQTFRRKAFLSRQHRLLRELMAQGRSAADLIELTIADVPPGSERTVYLQRRGELGIDIDDDSRLVVDESGDLVPIERIDQHLVWIRTVSVSIEGNAEACRGLLAVRYGTDLPPEDAGRTSLPLAQHSPSPVVINRPFKHPNKEPVA